MLGNITQNTNGNSSYKKEVQDLTNSKLKDLTVRVDDLEDKVEDLSDEVITEKVITDNISVSKTVSSNAVNTTDITTQTVDSNSVTTESLTSSKAEIGELNTTHIDSVDIKGQILDKQTDLEIGTVKADNAELDNLTVSGKVTFDNATFSGAQNFGVINAGSVNLTDRLNATDVLTSTIETTDNVEVGTDLFVSNETETKELIVDNNATVSGTITSPQAQITNLNVDAFKSTKYIDNSVYYGRQFITLTPALGEGTSDYFLIKIRKHDDTNKYYDLDNIYLEVKDNFAIKFLTSYGTANEDWTDPDTGETVLGTKGATLAILHQKSIRNVFLISEDDDYYYMECKVTNEDGSPCELKYSYNSNEGEIENLIEYEYSVHPDYNWFYRTQATSEMIMLGDSTSKYQFTILGKLKATIEEIPDIAEFDTLQINHNLFLRSTYNESTSQWLYKKSTDNQYLSSVNEYYDTDLSQWVTHIEWKSPINNTELGKIVITDDVITEYQEPISEGETVEYRTVQSVELGSKNKLITLQTLANYNGKVKSSTSTSGVEIEEKNPIFNSETLTSGTSNIAQYAIWNNLYPFGKQTYEISKLFDLYGITTEVEVGYKWENLTAKDNHYIAAIHSFYNQKGKTDIVKSVSTFTITNNTTFSVELTKKQTDSLDNTIYTFTVTYGTKTFDIKTGVNSYGEEGSLTADSYITVYCSNCFYGTTTRKYSPLGIRSNMDIVFIYDSDGLFIGKNCYILWKGEQIVYPLNEDDEAVLPSVTDLISIDFTKGYTMLSDFNAYRASNSLDPLTSADSLKLLVGTEQSTLGNTVTSSTFTFADTDTYNDCTISTGGESYSSVNTKIVWGEISGITEEEYNAISKLATVDEGTWEAGDITTPNLTVTESVTINPESIVWHNNNYKIWLDGDSPATTDLDWVTV